MAQIIRKKRSTTTAIPTSLEFGESAVSNVGGKLREFTGNALGVPVEVGGDNKMNVVGTPTNNNILVTDANGQAVDSGKVFSIDGTLSANSDNNIPTEKAIKAYADTKVSSSLLGASNGVATLDTNGKLNTSQLPSGIAGGLTYQGTWNADTNTPTITSGVGTNGYYYKVSTAGTTTIDTINDWQVGDWIIYNGTTWDKIDNTETVSSVNGYTGAVTLTKSDVGLGNVDNTSDLNKPISTATQTALDLKADITYVDAQTTTAGTGTSIVGTSVNVLVDGSTLEVNISNQLQVKDLGITDAKLTQITTANKVAGSSVQLATNGGLENNVGLQIKNDTTTGATVSQLNIGANGVGVKVDNTSIKHNAGELYVDLVDGGTF
jgi:hypothetical protein